MGKRTLVFGIVGAIVIVFAFYVCCGLFVVQPIGAIPHGATVLHWRVGTTLPFVSSADGLLLERVGSVSLFSRGIALGKMSEGVVERKIMNLPYSHQLYLISTNGKELER